MGNWVRWILVLPAAAGALIAMRTFSIIFINMYTGLGFGALGESFIKIFYSFVGPAFFVLAGASVAPYRRFHTSVFLAILIIGFSMVVELRAFGVGTNILLYVVPVLAVIWACNRVYRKNREEIVPKNDNT